MPNKANKNHEDEAMYKIPFIEYEYMRYRASRKMNRITCALAVTNIAWFVFVLAYIFGKL